MQEPLILLHFPRRLCSLLSNHGKDKTVISLQPGCRCHPLCGCNLRASTAKTNYGGNHTDNYYSAIFKTIALSFNPKLYTQYTSEVK